MSWNRIQSLKFIAAISLASCLASGRAEAGAITSMVQIDVSAEGHSGSWFLEVPLTGEITTWQLPSDVQIYSSTDPELLLATIDDLSMQLDTDPAVVLNFAVIAGAVNTNFSISSPNVPFAGILNPQSFAQAGITVTDNNGDGATLTGLFPGVKAYEAQYNGATGVFADLVSPVVAPGFGGALGQERLPPIPPNRIPIAGLVTDIESDFWFTLTAFDSAGATSRFDVVPEPSSIVLAIMGGVALLWHAHRRRRK